MPRTGLFSLTFIGVVLAALTAQADDYPTRPVRVVVPFAAAGVTDIVARVVFDRVSQATGKTIVIDNRPGAGGTIAVEQVVNAAPDGYTLVMGDPSGSLPANVTLYPELKYDPRRDLLPIANLGLDRRGASGGQYAAGEDRPGAGGARQEQARRIDVRLDRHRHAGSPQRRVVLRARRHQGRARALSRGRAGRHRSDRRPHLVLDRADPDHAAADTARARFGRLPSPASERSTDLPGVPTVRETGIGDFDASTTYALFAPAGTPREPVDWLKAQIRNALDDQGVVQKLRRRACSRNTVRRKKSRECSKCAPRNGPTSSRAPAFKIN